MSVRICLDRPFKSYKRVSLEELASIKPKILLVDAFGQGLIKMKFDEFEIAVSDSTRLYMLIR